MENMPTRAMIVVARFTPIMAPGAELFLSQTKIFFHSQIERKIKAICCLNNI